MGLFKKKEKKKLTTDQLISRWSVVILIIMLLMGSYFSIKSSLKDIEDSTIGNVSVFDYLDETYDPTSLLTSAITDDDKANVKTKTTEAGLDIFKNSYMTSDKYANVGNANDFSLTSNECAFFVNEILAITQNTYGIDYNEINITANDEEITIKFVASITFNAFCGISSREKEIYAQLGYKIPQTIYLTSYSVKNSTSVTNQVSFNALNSDKSKEIKDYMNSKNKDDIQIENLCYEVFSSTLNDFCTRTNTTYTLSSGYVNFVSTLGD